MQSVLFDMIAEFLKPAREHEQKLAANSQSPMRTVDPQALQNIAGGLTDSPKGTW